MRICFLILNSFDVDSRARLICQDILDAGFDLDIIATVGGKMQSFGKAKIHRIAQPVWPIGQMRFIWYSLKAATLARNLKADVYHAVDLDTLWMACAAAKKTGGRIVYESRELYTEQLSLYKRHIPKSFWGMLENKLIKKIDAVVTVSESIADELARRYGISKPEVVMNVAGTTPKDERVDFRRAYGIDSKFLLLFQGVLRPGQGINRVLRAIVSLPNVAFVVVGDGPDKPEIEKQVRELGLESRVIFTGAVSPDKLAGYTAGADAGVMLIEPLALNSYLALPQKLFQYISAGVPPIVSNLPELRRTVDENNLGLVLGETSTEKDTKAIDEFLQNSLGQAKKACHIAGKKFRWEIEGRKLIEIYKRLIE